MSAPRIGSLCTGYGGLDRAVQEVFGGETVWHADIDPGASAILAHHWPEVPNLGDLTTTGWGQVVDTFGRPHIVTGGYPCQPFSDAGLRKGTEDDRHIWPHIANALRVLRPRLVVLENVRGHLGRGFDTVLADLARLGFDAQWCLASASEVGAPHRRTRLFVFAVAQDADGPVGGERWLAAPGQASAGGAWSDAGGRGGASAADAGRAGLPVGQVEHHGPQRPAAERGCGESPADTSGDGRHERRPEPARVEGGPGVASGSAPDWGTYGPAIRRWEAVTGRTAPWATDVRGRLAPVFVEWLMGLPAGHVTDVPGLSRNAQLKALGNGVVPQQAAAAIRLLHQRAFGTTTAEAAA